MRKGQGEAVSAGTVRVGALGQSSASLEDAREVAVNRSWCLRPPPKRVVVVGVEKHSEQVCLTGQAGCEF